MFIEYSSYKISNTDKLIIKNTIDKLHQNDRKGLNNFLSSFGTSKDIVDYIIYYWNCTKHYNTQF